MGQIGQGVFGKRDPNATNDVMNGQTVATGTPGAQTVPDPNQGLTRGNKLARGLVQGLGTGLQNQSAQQKTMNRAGGSMIQPQQQPMVDPSYFNPKMSNPFFGG